MTWIAPAPSPVDGPHSGVDRPILEGDLIPAGAPADFQRLRDEWHWRTRRFRHRLR